MTFYAHLVFRLLKTPWILQPFLFQELPKRKARQQLLSVISWLMWKRKGDISQYCNMFLFFIPQCVCRTGCCFVFKLGLWKKLTVFVLHHVYYRISQHTLCCLSEETYHADSGSDHLD